MHHHHVNIEIAEQHRRDLLADAEQRRRLPRGHGVLRRARRNRR